MSIQIKKNKEPSMPICVMNCDKPLCEKLKKYALFDEAFSMQKTTLVLGKPGQGKSSLVYAWFKTCLKRKFDKIFYICPANSASSNPDNIFLKLPENQIFDELNEDVLNEIVDSAMNRESKDDKLCIIIDDCAADLKKKSVINYLKKIAMNKRHMGIYQTIILSQTFFSLEKELRRLVDNIFLFKIGQNDMKNLFDEVMPDKEKYSKQIQKIAFEKPHDYLYINLQNGKLFKKFDEILINEE